MPGIKGDFRKLAALTRKVKALGRRDTRRALNLELGEEAMGLVQEGFDRGMDPYGLRWKPPARRKGQPMMDTGRLRYGFSRRFTSEGFYLSNRTQYASYLQKGTRQIVARRMLPGARPSPIWNRRFASTHRAFVRARMGVR